MGIWPESSITLTWHANAAVDILIGVEFAGAEFASFLQCGGGIIGAGWSALPPSMVEKYDFQPKLFPPKIVWCNI